MNPDKQDFSFTEMRRVERARGRFIAYEEIVYRGPDGQERTWETVERARAADAVMVIAWLQPSERLVLVRQLRPPAQGVVLEFPAGLVDANEAPSDAAIRELREETGYHGMPRKQLPVSYNTPGISGETVITVLMDIAEARAANQAPQPAREECEWMETILVARTELAAFLEHEMASRAKFDSKVLAYIHGVLLGSVTK